MPTWTVISPESSDDRRWQIVCDGKTITTRLSTTQAWVVLGNADLLADETLVWRRTDEGGFESVAPAPVNVEPICPNCSAVTEYCGHCGARLGD
jgi:hypothetical protein